MKVSPLIAKLTAGAFPSLSYERSFCPHDRRIQNGPMSPALRLSSLSDIARVVTPLIVHQRARVSQQQQFVPAAFITFSILLFFPSRAIYLSLLRLLYFGFEGEIAKRARRAYAARCLL